NSSSGAIQAWMRTSEANGRGRRVQRLSPLYNASAIAPVAAMCSDANSPARPSTRTRIAISTYQNTPSPRRLATANIRRTPMHAPIRFARRHQPASRASIRSSGGEACMASTTRERGEDVVEGGRDVFLAQAGHGIARGGAHGAAQVRVAAEVAGRGDEALFVARRDRRAVGAVAQVLAGGAVVEGDRRHPAGHGERKSVGEGKEVH